MDCTILVPTHNLVPVNIFKTVIDNVLSQVESDGLDVELVIVSHYPVTDEYKSVDLPIVALSGHEGIGDAIVKNPILSVRNCNIPVRNFVVGERAYSLETIYAQLMLGLEHALCENIVIVEHDVLYPSGYFRSMIDALNSGVDFCCWRNCSFFCRYGFYEVPRSLAFSRFSFKSHFLSRFISSVSQEEMLVMEPEIDLDCGAFSSGEHGIYDDYGINAKYTILEGEDVLDVKHGLNSSGNVFVENYEENHPYWGNEKKWLNLIGDDFDQVALSNPIYAYGLFLE